MFLNHNFELSYENYLLQYEAEHNLLLGISHTLLHDPDHYPDPPYLVARTTDDNSEILNSGEIGSFCERSSQVGNRSGSLFIAEMVCGGFRCD
ncbi:hypothetical protein [Leptodesmis sp.]|uniref:hypothetical protein n=1 Tax=Leptodesmis sp. TaxID=3100501 RepID=UPI0040534B1F